jgi:hypothetical protein
MSLVYRYALLPAVALTLAVGCGSSNGSTSDSETSGAAEEDSPPPKNFQIFPPNLYSGFDGTNTYKVPFSVFKNEGPVTLTIDDMSLVSIEAKNNDGTQVMLKTLKAGTTMVHATAGGKTVSAPLSIAMYTPEQNAVGKKRYTNAADADNPACEDCHGAGKGPDHTPTEVDADPDEDIINTFLTGKDPEGRPVGMEYKQILKGKTHMWKVTMEEQTGLVSYLRSLTPTGYPEYEAETAGE